MIMISASKIRKSYREGDSSLQVLTNINLSVELGELVSITGQSGCGKSTLLHILGLLDEADGGELLMKGSPVSAMNRNSVQFRSRHIGFIFQFHYLLEDLTAEENLALPLLIQGIPYAKCLSTAGEWLKKLDLYERKNHYPSTLSGGEQQRIAIGRAMIHQPDIVLADEPTGNLDPLHSSDVLSLMLDMQEQFGQTFIIVTHNKEIAEKADRQYKLENGILVEHNKIL